MTERDLEGQNQDEICEFKSLNIYKILPLEFGGFLAFEPEYIHVHKKEIKMSIISKKLRDSIKVTSICSIDTYDPATKTT